MALLRSCAHAAEKVVLRLETAAQGRAVPPRVGVVVVAWDEGRARAVTAAVDAWAAPAGRVLVLNRLLDLAPAGWQVVAGTNAAAEFSGFDEGVAEAADDPEVWVLLNDRALAYDDDPLAVLTAPVLRLVAERPLLVGHLHELGRPVLAGAPALGSYVRTNLLVLSTATLAALGQLTAHPLADADDLLPPGWPLADVVGGPLAPDYLAFLTRWLTGAPGPGEQAWYRATRDAARLPELRAKAVSIVNEHLLSARAQAAGVTVVHPLRVAQGVGLARHGPTLAAELARWRTTPMPAPSRRRRLASLAAAATAATRARRA